MHRQFLCRLLLASALLCALYSIADAAEQRAPHSSALQAFVPPPILMYHRVDVQSPGDRISRDLTVSPLQFEHQLRYLKTHGFSAISMAQLEERLQRRLPLDRTVVLTFDDGYSDQYRYAVPLLRRFADGATFYIVTSELDRARHLTWRELQAMKHDRMDIAAHGVQHDDLSQMDQTQQVHQIDDSVRTLRAFLHMPIESYAYPSGRFNRETLDIVRKEGLPLAVTTDRINLLLPESRFELTRLRVRGGWNVTDFARAIAKELSARHLVIQ